MANRYGYGSGPKSKFKSYKAHEYVISSGILDESKPKLLWVDVKDNISKSHWKMEFDLAMFPNKGFKEIKDPYNKLQTAIKSKMNKNKKYEIIPNDNVCIVQLMDDNLMLALFPIQQFYQFKKTQQQMQKGIYIYFHLYIDLTHI